MEKGPNFKSPLTTLKTRDMLVMMFVMMILNFEVKKLTGRSPPGAKMSPKAGFTTEITAMLIVCHAYNELHGQICY